uniref:EF-hand domain-containing protein n=2 Tax=Meloidogyne TaxID=189290 RepID=A0A915NMA3_9BILA
MIKIIFIVATTLILLFINNVESTEQQQHENQSSISTDQINKIFQKIDENNDGFISLEEAIKYWKELAKEMDLKELKEKLERENAKTLEEAVEKGFNKKVDKNGDGKISKQEFFEYMNE